MSFAAYKRVWDEIIPTHRPTSNERLFLLALADRFNPVDGPCYPYFYDLAEKVGCADSTVRDLAQRLWYAGLIDVEPRVGKGRSHLFWIVMDDDAVDRKAAARRRLSPYDDDGLDRLGHPRGDEPAPPHPYDAPSDIVDSSRISEPTGPVDSAVDETCGEPSKPPITGGFADPKPPESRRKTAGDRRHIEGNIQPATASTRSSADSQGWAPGDEHRDLGFDGCTPDWSLNAPRSDAERRTVDACRVLARRDLEDLDDPVEDRAAFLDRAALAHHARHGVALCELAVAHPGWSATTLADALAAPDPDFDHGRSAIAGIRGQLRPPEVSP